MSMNKLHIYVHALLNVLEYTIAVIFIKMYIIYVCFHNDANAVRCKRYMYMPDIYELIH